MMERNSRSVPQMPVLTRRTTTSSARGGASSSSDELEGAVRVAEDGGGHGVGRPGHAYQHTRDRLDLRELRRTIRHGDDVRDGLQFIDGDLDAGRGGGRTGAGRPGDGAPFAEARAGRAADVDAAVAAARRAAPAGRRTSATDRGARLALVAAGVRARERLAALEAQDVGKPLSGGADERVHRRRDHRLLRRRRRQADRRHAAHPLAGLPRLHAAAAARRVRGHHAVERPRGADRRQRRPGARRRQHRRPQARPRWPRWWCWRSPSWRSRPGCPAGVLNVVTGLAPRPARRCPGTPTSTT